MSRNDFLARHRDALTGLALDAYRHGLAGPGLLFLRDLYPAAERLLTAAWLAAAEMQDVPVAEMAAWRWTVGGVVLEAATTSATGAGWASLSRRLAQQMGLVLCQMYDFATRPRKAPHGRQDQTPQPSRPLPAGGGQVAPAARQGGANGVR